MERPKLEEFKKVRIKGGIFKSPTELELFAGRLNILYGRNGSGKSSIAKCLKTLNSTEDNLQGYECSCDDPYVEQSVKSCIHVFDEEFIRENLLIEDEGLKSIVMLGSQVGIDAELKEKQKEEVKVTATLENKEKELTTSTKEYGQCLDKLKKKLRKDGGWADRDGKLRGNKIQSGVTEKEIDRIIDTSGSNHPEEIYSEYREKNKLFEKTAGSQPIENLILTPPSSHTIPNIANLLSKKIQDPQLSDRDKHLIEIVHGPHGEYISKVHEVFDDENSNICPLCLQSVSKEYKQRLFDKVSLLLNKEAENYSSELRTIADDLRQWAPTKISEELRSIIEPSSNTRYHDACQTLESTYYTLADTLIKRSENIFACEIPKLDLEKLNFVVLEYEEVCKEIEDEVNKYNETVQKRKELQSELLLLNKKIASIECATEYQEYKNAKAKVDNTTKEKTELEQRLSELGNRISELQSKMKNEAIALNLINEALAYVFFNKKRLTLHTYDGKYLLKANGTDVQPRQVSTGERNIIALCYFFAALSEKKKADELAKDDIILVLDDPISSFDRDNRVGVESFLHWQLREILAKSRHSKILMMTHDISAAFDVVEIIAKGINCDTKNKQLKNLQIVELNNRNEYSSLLNDIHLFATETDTSDLRLTIGNEMRRLMEAYSTLVYKNGIDKMIDIILQELPSDVQLYYRNLIMKFIFNSSSHKIDQAKALEANIEPFSEDELKVTAKSVLMLFCHLNKGHLRAYLGEDVVKQVEQWINDGEDKFDPITT